MQLANKNYRGKKGRDELIELERVRFEKFNELITCKDYTDAIRFFDFNEAKQDDLSGSSQLAAKMGLLKTVPAEIMPPVSAANNPDGSFLRTPVKGNIGG